MTSRFFSVAVKNRDGQVLRTNYSRSPDPSPELLNSKISSTVTAPRPTTSFQVSVQTSSLMGVANKKERPPWFIAKYAWRSKGPPPPSSTACRFRKPRRNRFEAPAADRPTVYL